MSGITVALLEGRIACLNPIMIEILLTSRAVRKGTRHRQFLVCKSAKHLIASHRMKPRQVAAGQRDDCNVS